MDDDLYGIIKHKRTGNVLTASPIGEELRLTNLNPSPSKFQRWRQVGNSLVSKGKILKVLKSDQDKNVVVQSSIKDDPNQAWEIIEISETSISPQLPTGYFTIKNMKTGKYVSIQDKGLALSDDNCPNLYQFVWVPTDDGVHGNLMSKTTQQYLSTSPFNRNIYMRDRDWSSSFQNWRRVQNQLEGAKTIDREPGVLAQDKENNELTISKMECDKYNLNWEFEPIDPSLSTANEIPEEGSFGIEDHNGLLLSVVKGKFILADSNCDINQQWFWEWDADGKFGQIVPKGNPTMALDLLARRLAVRLKTKNDGANQKWRLLSNSITSKLVPTLALTVNAEGSLAVSQLECNAENQSFAIVQLTCDTDDGE